MGAADIIALAVIIILLICAVRYCVISGKKGCNGCSGCPGCFKGQCGECKNDPEDVHRKEKNLP